MASDVTLGYGGREMSAWLWKTPYIHNVTQVEERGQKIAFND